MHSSEFTDTMLIADSGATKTDWCLIRHGEIIGRFQSQGISPIYQSEEAMAQEIKNNLLPQLPGRKVQSVCFYGSGCIPSKTAAVRNALHQTLGADRVEVYSDLLAAAHSLCGHEPGIACILGTGSNSCQWDGKKIVRQVSPLGFILGDEGSGAHLGKQLVSNALKNQLTDGIKEALLEAYHLTPATIIEKVYRQPFPSRFLASLSPFLNQHIDDPSIRHIVTGSFSSFFDRNVMQYDYRKNCINFVGSIAWHFSDILRETASEKGIVTGKIEQSPMAGLIRYHRLAKPQGS
ncbi:MAG: ATPase [Proteiniphilum sp.]|nr:ATPase [Proteiniphilum sp.]